MSKYLSCSDSFPVEVEHRTSRVFSKNIRGNLMKILYVLSALYFTYQSIRTEHVDACLFVRMIVRQRQMTKAQVAFALLRFLHVESCAYAHSLSLSLSMCVCVCVCACMCFCIDAPCLSRLFRINSGMDCSAPISIRRIHYRAYFLSLYRSYLRRSQRWWSITHE